MSRNPYVHQTIAHAIAAHGVETLFGLMGDANLFVVDHFVRAHGGTFVPAAHEGSSVLMALAFSHVSGRVGAATITQGPALTNCVTALTEGARAQTPMVLLAGDTAVDNPRHDQNIDQREVVKVTGAGFEQVRTPQSATEDVARAFYRARVERRPIVLNMPNDFMWMEGAPGTIVHPVFDTPAYVPEGPTFDEALGMIASARRPIVLAGRGAIHARDALIRLADRMHAPLATTVKAKGLFNDHPYNMDIFGTLSTPEAQNAIAKADCVVAFGSSLNGFTTAEGTLLKGKRVVQVNNTPAEIGKNMLPGAALIADSRLTADNIVHWLDEAEIPATGFTAELDGGTLTARPAERGGKEARAGSIDFVQALERLEEAVPKDRILSTDVGRFMTEVWYRISAPHPQRFLMTVNFGSVGLGLQEAIGAGCAAPDVPVLHFTGDGGFMMGGLNEFNTAVRAKRDLIVVVCNDSAYGAEHIQFTDRDMNPGLSQFEWPSFAAIGTALGGTGVTVGSAADLDTAITAIATRDRPLLIELRLDADDMPRVRC